MVRNAPSVAPPRMHPGANFSDTETYTWMNGHTSISRCRNTPGLSGFEAAAARVWRAEAETFADRVSSDTLGNSMATVDSAGGGCIMLGAHTRVTAKPEANPSRIRITTIGVDRSAPLTAIRRGASEPIVSLSV
jgi:hypothetical protein